jgi:hypothetical protein
MEFRSLFIRLSCDIIFCVLKTIFGDANAIMPLPFRPFLLHGSEPKSGRQDLYMEGLYEWRGLLFLGQMPVPMRGQRGVC